jgi:hypothetical protein
MKQKELSAIYNSLDNICTYIKKTESIERKFKQFHHQQNEQLPSFQITVHKTNTTYVDGNTDAALEQEQK